MKRLRPLALAVCLGAVTSVLPALGAGVDPATAAPTFGDRPLDDVLHWAAQERRCGLTTNKLAALMLAPTYPETGAPNGRAPSPMTLSRWDNQAGLHSFGTVGDQPRAFWHPGVGMWQFDSAGLGAPFTAAQRIDTFVVAAQTAATMAARWCTNPTLAYVWAPWFGCGPSICRDIFTTIYQQNTDRLVGVARDASVQSAGGMTRHTCTGAAQSGEFTCWRVDPAQAQGYAGFTAPGFGPAPLTAPFFVYAAGGREYRHWLRADTGYQRGVWATRPLGSNARTSLTWHAGDGVVDLGPSSGGGGGGSAFTDIPASAWYLGAVTWAVDAGIVQGFADGTFRPTAPVRRSQGVAWLWAVAGRPEATTRHRFTDVGQGAAFAPAVSWAAEHGVVSGFRDGTFRPRARLTRAQFAKMLWVAADRPPAPRRAPYRDVRAGAAFAPAVNWLSGLGPVPPTPNSAFRPRAVVTRARGVAWLRLTHS